MIDGCRPLWKLVEEHHVEIPVLTSHYGSFNSEKTGSVFCIFLHGSRMDKTSFLNSQLLEIHHLPRRGIMYHLNNGSDVRARSLRTLPLFRSEIFRVLSTKNEIPLWLSTLELRPKISFLRSANQV